MTSKMRAAEASDILAIISEETGKLAGLSDGELLNTAKQNHRLLIRMDQPGFLGGILSRGLDDKQMDLIKDGTLRDYMILAGAAIIAAVQDDRPESLHDIVSSLYGVDLYPQLVMLGKTGILPAPAPPPAAPAPQSGLGAGPG